jgi:hypothetical protein
MNFSVKLNKKEIEEFFHSGPYFFRFHSKSEMTSIKGLTCVFDAKTAKPILWLDVINNIKKLLYTFQKLC